MLLERSRAQPLVGFGRHVPHSVAHSSSNHAGGANVAGSTLAKTTPHFAHAAPVAALASKHLGQQLAGSH